MTVVVHLVQRRHVRSAHKHGGCPRYPIGGVLLLSKACTNLSKKKGRLTRLQWSLGVSRVHEIHWMRGAEKVRRLTPVRAVARAQARARPRVIA